MSFDVDEKEFYETFDEMVADPNFGLEGAKAWAWSALEFSQYEKNREEILRRRLEAQLTYLARFQVLTLRVYEWVRSWPRRLKYRLFPKHRLRAVVRKNGEVTTFAPLAPGMVPAKKIWDIGDPAAPVKHINKPFFGVLMSPLPQKKAPPEKKE